MQECLSEAMHLCCCRNQSCFKPWALCGFNLIPCHYIKVLKKKDWIIYIYIYIYECVCIYIYIYIYIYDVWHLQIFLTKFREKTSQEIVNNLFLFWVTLFERVWYVLLIDMYVCMWATEPNNIGVRLYI
jgi:hypothetical protein